MRRHSWRYMLNAKREPVGHRWRTSQSIAYRLRLLKPLSASARRSTVGPSGGAGAGVGKGVEVSVESWLALGESGGLAVAGDAPGRRAFHLRNDADAAGHVLLVGLGRKSVAATGAAPLRWERRALAVARERWPGARIVWRPKGEPIAMDGLPMSVGVPIERALLGARAVVCAHSNVAVDACVAGVPVYCEGGAAASLYAETPSPDARARVTFLRQLSWFEWHRRDASAAWAWVLKLLLATGGGLPCG